MNPDNIVVFLDSIQRTIIATQAAPSTDGKLAVTKPVVLNVQPTPDKKLQVQLYPLFFREFTADRDEFAKWFYDKSVIVMSDVQLEPNLIAQYKQMFQTQNVTANTPVVKLFDDEKN